MSPVVELLEHTLSNGLDALLIGPPESGKTTLALSLFPDAPLLHGGELTDEHRMLLRSLAHERVVVVENITTAGFEFLRPILRSKRVLGVRLECSFLLTSRETFEFKEGVSLTLLSPSAEAWLQAADTHPAVSALISNQEGAYERYGPRRLEMLSKLLRSRPSERILKGAIESILQADEETVRFLIEEIAGKEAPARPYAGNVFTGTQEQSDRFEQKLIAAILTQPTQELEAQLLTHIESLRPQKAVRLLSRLLHQGKAETTLSALLSSRKIQLLIDEQLAFSLGT